jgi:hypothetical protein
MGSGIGRCLHPKTSPTNSPRESVGEEHDSTHSSGFEVVTRIHGHHEYRGVLDSLPQGQTELVLSGSGETVICALDWRSLKESRSGEGFKLPLTGIDLSGPLGRCLPSLIEDACSKRKKDSKVMEWDKGTLAMWLYTQKLSVADWEFIERKTVEPILRMRMMGLTDDQIAKALQPGPFRDAVMAGDIEFHRMTLSCSLKGPELVECVQSCVTQLVHSGSYHLAALMLQQNWDEATLRPQNEFQENRKGGTRPRLSSPRELQKLSVPLWGALRGIEESLRARLDDSHDWGDDNEPYDLEFHRLKSLLCNPALRDRRRSRSGAGGSHRRRRPRPEDQRQDPQLSGHGDG